HKTENPDDEYLGSGTYIKRAVAKYGPEKFRKDVLFVYADPESAFTKEAKLLGAQAVNRRFLIDADFRERKNAASRATIRMIFKPEYTRKAAKVRAEQWRGGKHTEETRKKMKAGRLGAKNGSFGSRWMVHPSLGSKRVEIK